jgi:hypothetical protein
MLVGVSKTVKSNVTGGGGGGSGGSTAPIWIRTDHQTEMDLWFKDDAGRESHARLEFDVPLREGQCVSLVRGYLGGGDVWCLVINHTTQQVTRLDCARGLMQPSAPEVLSLVGISLAVLLLCLLLGQASTEFGWGLAIVYLVGLGLALRARWESLCGKLADHCYRAGKNLL